MNRSPDERVTKDIARQICQRQGFKAFLTGSISNIGSHYVVTLEATNAQTGDTIALEQAEADSKEQVLAALGTVATNLRKQLGESLASIQKYDKPIHQRRRHRSKLLNTIQPGSSSSSKAVTSTPFLPSKKRRRSIRTSPAPTPRCRPCTTTRGSTSFQLRLRARRTNYAIGSVRMKGFISLSLLRQRYGRAGEVPANA